MKQRKDLTLDYWRQNVDDLLRFNDQAVLEGPGTVSREAMTRTAHDRYESFDFQRCVTEAVEADAEDLRQIEELERELKQKNGD